MARYDDGGIKFAEDTFAESRAYKEKVAKDQEKFTKRLFAVDTLVKGASFLINRRAEEADTNMLPQKAKYQTLNNRALNIRTEENERVKAGTSVIDYLSNKYYEQLTEKAGQQYSYLNKGQYDKAIRAEADRLAGENLSEYKDLVTASNNIPSFEDFTNFYEDQADMPRNLFSWLTKGTKKFFTKETEETIKYKNEKADDALYGTKMFDKYKSLDSAFLAYDKATGDGLRVKKIIDNLHITTGKANSEFTKTVETPPIYDYDKGTITKNKVIWIATEKLDGTGAVEYKPENRHTVATSVKQMTDEEQGFVDEDVIKNLYDLVKPEFRNNIDKYLSSGRVTKTDIDNARIWLNANPTAYIIDGSNEKSLEESFEKWMSITIQNLKVDANGILSGTEGYDDSTGEHIAHDPDQDGIYTINATQRDKAEKVGITANLLRQEYRNTFAVRPRQEKDEQEEILGFVPTSIDTLLDDKNKNAFNEYVENNDDFYDLFKSKIEATPARFVDLGTQELNKLFADFGFPEDEKEYNIFYDKETKQVIIKK